MFGNGVVWTHLVKMRLYWSREGTQSNTTGVLIRRKETQRQKHTGRRQSCDERSRDESDAFTSQRLPANTRS